MKAKQVMQLLSISRPTLYRYTRNGIITATKLDNGTYDYHDSSVLKIIKKDNRKNVIYARVSTYKQKKDLANQVKKLQQYAIDNNIQIDHVYQDISSGLDLDRNHFSTLIDLVISHQIQTIYITHQDRLTRLSFKTIKQLFDKFNVKIVVISKEQDIDYDNDNEVFEELISLMHIFTTKMYSKRRKNQINIYKNNIKDFLKTTRQTRIRN